MMKQKNDDKTYETDYELLLNFPESSDDESIFDDLSDISEIYDIVSKNECSTSHKIVLLNKKTIEFMLRKEMKCKHFIKKYHYEFEERF